MSWQIALQSALIIGSGGFLGAILRAYVTSISSTLFPHAIQFGTAIVNMTASLALGLLFFLFSKDFLPLNNNVRLFIFTGFLGAFSTYSTFALESYHLLEQNLFAYFIIYMTLNIIGSLALIALGYKIGSMIIR